jgi:hypothetical protein
MRQALARRQVAAAEVARLRQVAAVPRAQVRALVLARVLVRVLALPLVLALPRVLVPALALPGRQPSELAQALELARKLPPKPKSS